MDLLNHMCRHVMSIFILVLGSATGVYAQNINCGTDYTVKPGDFLSQIAAQAYGEPSAFELIYNSNRHVIGVDPAVIAPGQVLQIPCIDGNTTTTQATAEANIGTPPYRFVLYHQWAPFLDEESESGGMLTEIVRRALEESDEKPEYKMHFVSDFNFILDPLLMDHAYDMSVGYTKPNCEAYDALGEESQFRCNSLDWSQPLYEEVIAYHSLTKEPSLKLHSELFGKRICRPDGYTTADMDTAGVKEPAVTMVRPETPADCMTALLNGEADFAALAIDVAEGVAMELDAESQFKMHKPLNHVSTVHVVIAKTHPNASSMIQTVDDGLDKLKSSGEWFNIVRHHMSEHRKNSQ